MVAKNKLVCGIGINDADYKVQNMTRVNGKVIRLGTCPYYERWYDILRRISGKSHNKRRFDTYSNVTISEEWKTFSNFKSWMEHQRWRGLHLDKDYLSVFTGKRAYSKDQCVFISKELNGFLVLRGNDRGIWPLGAHYHKQSGKYLAACSVRGVRLRLGSHKTPTEAHRAWQKAKLDYGRELQELEENPRVQEALKVILDKLEEDYNNGVETKSLL